MSFGMVVAEVEHLGAVQPERDLAHGIPVRLSEGQDRVVLLLLLLLACHDAILDLPVALGDGPRLGERAAGKVVPEDELARSGEDRLELNACG